MIDPSPQHHRLTHLAIPVLAATLVFGGLGFFAQQHWSCTFDEGFHITRGTMRAATGDSRLSYYHPPLQNMICGFFAMRSAGDRLALPDTPAWRDAELYAYAGDFAAANAGTYPSMVRASRTGSRIFGVLLVALGVLWAGRAAGPAAAWVAAFGLALNPNLLAHGNLTTSDMGVAALTLAGSYFLWEFCRTDRTAWLLLSAFGFAAAAAAKFTGLIWLVSFLILCVPLLALQKRRPGLVLYAGIGLLFFGFLLVLLYGPSPQMIRASRVPWLEGRSMIAGRYLEGLVRMGTHALEGQSAYFGGRTFTQSEIWHLPATMALKNPWPWVLATLAAGAIFVRRRIQRPEGLIPWIPALVFAGLLFGVNQLAIGIRHTLPVLGLLLTGAAVWTARLRPPRLRQGFLGLLALSSLCAVGLSYPHYIPYFPAWAGGVEKGHQWLVDSNYDWGQDLEELVEVWPELVEENGGEPPHLIYFGFVDPDRIHGIDSSAPKLNGFMYRTAALSAGPEAYAAWKEALTRLDGTVVISLSALNLRPYGLDFGYLIEGEHLRTIGRCFRVYRLP